MIGKIVFINYQILKNKVKKKTRKKKRKKKNKA